MGLRKTAAPPRSPPRLLKAQPAAGQAPGVGMGLAAGCWGAGAGCWGLGLGAGGLGLGAGDGGWGMELGVGCWGWVPRWAFLRSGDPRRMEMRGGGSPGRAKILQWQGCVGFAVEVGIVLGLNAGLLGAVAEDPEASSPWWHREATTTYQGRASAPPRRSHPMQALQANCCGAGGQPEAPKSYRASTRAPACCLPLSPAPSSSSLPPLHGSGRRGEEPSAATSAQSRWHARGGGSPATSRTAKNY